MFIRRQDLAVLCFYYAGYSKIRNFIICLQQKPVTRFVTFHDILPDALGRFKTNLNFLKNNTNVVSIDDFLSNRLSFDKINTVITFDDGYKSWVTNAIPLLQNLELPATFFISSGFLELSKEEEEDFKKNKLFRKLPPRPITGCLSYNDVRTISNAGYIIGGHTKNHSNLSNMFESEQVEYEIVEDKRILEEIIGRNIDYFSYPGGDYANSKICLTDILKQTGYKGAVTTIPGYNGVGENPYMLRRELTDAAMMLQVFRARIYGNYDAVIFVKQILRNMRAQSKQ